MVRSIELGATGMDALIEGARKGLTNKALPARARAGVKAGEQNAETEREIKRLVACMEGKPEQQQMYKELTTAALELKLESIQMVPEEIEKQRNLVLKQRNPIQIAAGYLSMKTLVESPPVPQGLIPKGLKPSA